MCAHALAMVVIWPSSENKRDLLKAASRIIITRAKWQPVPVCILNALSVQTSDSSTAHGKMEAMRTCTKLQRAQAMLINHSSPAQLKCALLMLSALIRSR